MELSEIWQYSQQPEIKFRQVKVESLVAMVVIILFTALLGGPTALLLTYVPDKPRKIRILRTIAVVLLSLVAILFSYQLTLGADIPAFPRLIGIFGLITSILALLYEFKILKRKKITATDGASQNAQANGAKTYAVIFTSKRQDANHDLYYQHDSLLEEKIKTMPGYLKHFGIRHPETREGVTVAYFNSLEAIDKWRQDIEHQDAKNLAQSHFYENYNVEITEVINQYGWKEN